VGQDDPVPSIAEQARRLREHNPGWSTKRIATELRQPEARIAKLLNEPRQNTPKQAEGPLTRAVRTVRGDHPDWDAAQIAQHIGHDKGMVATVLQRIGG
jgi:hypothetical protein